VRGDVEHSAAHHKIADIIGLIAAQRDAAAACRSSTIASARQPLGQAIRQRDLKINSNSLDTKGMTGLCNRLPGSFRLEEPAGMDKRERYAGETNWSCLKDFRVECVV